MLGVVCIPSSKVRHNIGAEEFEGRLAEALDVPYVVATTSGSVALLVVLMALGIQRGDEVIVSNRPPRMTR